MESNIFYGPEDEKTASKVSLGRLFYEDLKSKKSSDILVIEKNTGEEISRGKLLQDTIRLAAALRNLGVKKGDILGIISTNSWKYLVTVISAFYIGATTVHINLSSTKDDLVHYLTIGRPKVLFIVIDVVAKIIDLKNELSFLQDIITFDEVESNEVLSFDDLLKRESDVNHASFEVDGDESMDALILYSSGTTGLPKGVIITQANLKSNFNGVGNILKLRDTTVLGLLPIFHVLGFFIAFGGLLFGKTLIILNRFKPELFLRTIEEHRISKLVLVPPLVTFLAESKLVDKYDLTCLEAVVFGAASLGEDVQSAVSKRLNVIVSQLYGTTEACGIACVPSGVRRPGSVGKLLPGCSIKIVDLNSGSSLGENSLGEIYCKGPGIMKGYVNDVEATREIMDGDGYMRTGDVGYIDDEGYLYLVDRIKDIIKYKGFQVPPAQLEAVLKKHPAIKDAAVIGKPDVRAGELPTACVVRQLDSDVTEQEIVDYVAGKVSAEKRLYGGVIFVDKIHTTPNGKVLRRELKKLL